MVVEYSCRDDYGVSHSKVSAWAGLHYFASRAGKAYNADSPNHVLTTGPLEMDFSK